VPRCSTAESISAALKMVSVRSAVNRQCLSWGAATRVGRDHGHRGLAATHPSWAPCWTVATVFCDASYGPAQAVASRCLRWSGGARWGSVLVAYPSSQQSPKLRPYLPVAESASSCPCALHAPCASLEFCQRSCTNPGETRRRGDGSRAMAVGRWSSWDIRQPIGRVPRGTFGSSGVRCGRSKQ